MDDSGYGIATPGIAGRSPGLPLERSDGAARFDGYETSSQAVSLPTAELLASLEIDLVDDMVGFDALQNEWERLESIDPHCTPFNTWEWLRLWWAYYGPGSELRILVARHGRRVMAIAPLYVTRPSSLGFKRGRVLRFIGAGGDTSPDYLGIIADPAWREPLEARLLECILGMRDWIQLQLSELRRPSSLDCELRRRLDGRRGYRPRGIEHQLGYRELPADWESYRQSLSRKRRKQINHRLNRLEAAGDYRLSLCESNDAVAEASDALIELHRQRWASKGQAGGFDSEAYEAFHRAVIQRFFDRESLWLATLSLNEDLIGVQYIYAWRRQLMFFQSGYSPEHERLSPGHVLFTWVIGQAIERGFERIDLLKGDHDYKRVYAPEVQRTGEHIFIRPGTRAALTAARDTVCRMGLSKRRQS